MEGGTPGGDNVEPRAARRTSEFDTAKLDNLRMKPLGAAQRASDRSALVIWDSQHVTAAGAGKNCQCFAPSAAERCRRTSKRSKHQRRRSAILQVTLTNVT